MSVNISGPDGVMGCVIFDIDGTLANVEHRRAHLPDWKIFNSLMHADTSIEPVCKLARVLHSHTHKIVLVTGREASFREITIEWCAKNRIRYDALYMRPTKDYRPDDEIKSELLDQILKDGYHPWLVFDDRNSVVKMWRSRGLICLQCADGDF